MTTPVPPPTPELSETLYRVLRLANGAIPFDRGAIHLLRGDVLVTQALYAEPGTSVDSSFLGATLTLDEGFCAYIAREGVPFLSANVREETRARPAPYVGSNLQIQSFLGVPLRDDGAVIGVLEMDSHTPNFFQPFHLELAEVVADQASLAIENARLYSEAQAQNRVLRERNHQLAALLDATESGIVMSDGSGRIVHINSVMCRFFRVEQREVIGSTVEEVTKHIAQRFIDPQAFRERSKWLYTHPRVVARDNLITDEPEPRLFERYSAPVYGEGGTRERPGRIEVYTDVTESRELEAQMRQYLDDMMTLHRIGVAMGTEQDLNELLHLVCEQACKLVDATGAAVALLDLEDPEQLLVPVVHGLNCGDEERVEQVDFSVAGKSIKQRRPAVISEDESDPEDLAMLQQQWQMASCVTVPLEARRRVIGALLVFSRDSRRFDEHDVQLLQIFASQATVTIDNTRLLKTAQLRRSELEELTTSINQNRSNLNAILQSMADGVIALDNREQIIFINQPLFELFDLAPANPDAWVGCRIEKLWPQLQEVAEVLDEERIKSGETVRVAVELHDARRAIELLHTPINDEAGRRVGYLLLFHDITELRANERMKDELLSVLSHELRTPLTSILGYSKLLADRLDAPANKRKRWATHILAKSRLLNRLVNEVLDLSRLNVEHFDLHLKPGNLEALVRRIVEEQRVTTDEHELVVETDGNLQAVPFDEDRIDQLLTNLIINAIKYSPNGGTITVRAARSEDWVTIDVQDQGLGIAPEYHERVFEPFFRVDNTTTRDVYGTGLGLPLCRGIAKAHGGDVTLTSEPRRGSTFQVHLPAK